MKKQTRTIWVLPLLLALFALGSCGDATDSITDLPEVEETTLPVVAGAVLGEGGAPAVDALVSLEPTLNGMSVAVLEARGEAPSLAKAAARRVAVTDEFGRFAFDGVEAGEYLLEASAENHLAAFESVEIAPLAALVDTVIVDVQLTPTGTLEGVATLENASDHASTVVYVEGSSYVAVTSANGDYSLTGVPVGSYAVRATHAGYLDETDAGSIAGAGDVGTVGAMFLRLNANIPPTALANGATTGVQDQPVPFAGSGTDVDGTIVLYEWDFEDDGVFDWSSPTTASTTHVYSAAGTYRAKLRVTDDDGGFGLAVIELQISASSSILYVSSSLGSDSNTGGIGDPVATLAFAYSLVSPSIGEIRVAAETFNEVPEFQGGVDVRGGFDLPSWTQGVGYSRFELGQSRALASNISDAATIERVQLVAGDAAPGSNSTALFSEGSTADLRFENCQFIAGRGGDGDPGNAGTNGLPGGSGGNGQPGDSTGSAGAGGAAGSASSSCIGGIGGAGGAPGANPGSPGGSGPCQSGLGGPGGPPGGPGQRGTDGNDGVDGGSGSPASNVGLAAGIDWTPLVSSAGSGGSVGRGGGGGGGGGGVDNTFPLNDGGGNGGGGGGGGGIAGSGGQGGEGGWGSFAVMLRASNPGFENCLFQTDVGGAGGAGGVGGVGGVGGLGGLGATADLPDIGRGGDGGNGGDGGGGGGGAGGPGGPSIGLFDLGGSTPTNVGASYSIGGGGPGGAGGGADGGTGASAPGGPSGITAQTN